MTVPAALTDASVQFEQMADAAHPALTSCHDSTGDDSAPADHTCSLCNLCHSAAADLADPTLPQSPLPDAAPRIALAHDTGRHAVGGLDRPPRQPLA